MEVAIFSLLPLTFALQNQGLNEEATNAQIDTLILDNRKKLNQIIGELAHSAFSECLTDDSLRLYSQCMRTES